ncbi:response regulator [Sulfurospirillum arcachonense]|uniref:response regulator n=1 Tax=Sulfurospirillum arcachonense TaxID=57666 RepID=UPI0004BAAF6E|nr:response regulator [Sulfurospirillum arcachonense]
MKFLVVDDSKTMRRIVLNTLNNIGYKDVTLAEDGNDAMKKMKKNHYDAIMTDWNMPIMNGLELVKSARKMDAYKDTPIIMITTEGGRDQVLTALKNGVNNYIIKPFNSRTLREKLEDII